MSTLLMLPGLDGTGELFQGLLSALPADIPTQVGRYPTDQTLSLEEHVRCIVRQRPPGDVVLLAESFSGLVALSLIAEERLPIRGAIFCGCFATPPRPWLLKLAPMAAIGLRFSHWTPPILLRWFCLGQSASLEQIALLRAAIARVSPETLAGRLRIVSRTQRFADLRFDTPCCYLQATDDRLVPRQAAEQFIERFELCHVERVEGPHFLLQSEPVACATIIAEQYRRFTRPAFDG